MTKIKKEEKELHQKKMRKKEEKKEKIKFKKLNNLLPRNLNSKKL